VQDGRIGPATVKAAQDKKPDVIVNALCDARLEFLKRLPTWGEFGKGWSSRVSSVRSAALSMAAQPAPIVIQPPVTDVPQKPIVITTEEGKPTTVSTTTDTPPAAQP
jgi:lysozyme family protein